MTRSRGQFDTRHDDERDGGPRSGDGSGGGRGGHGRGTGAVDGVRSWLSFHRVEFLLVCWFVLGGVALALAYGLGGLLFGPQPGVPEVARVAFWTTVLVAVPALAASLLVHGVVDAYRVALADGDVTSVGRAVVRILQSASAATFAVGVAILFQDTAPANADFDPAALVSAFLLLAGFAGMVAFVAGDGLVRLARGTW
ncbi:hypothetical protein [Halorubellus salinus]|uniref:hypothetical protein n=1 Tax=Halorubellus salinus TaxID=755309 RepID=UPI001D07A4D6|nr:hypothetical protein [Halorubellus salinus]